MKTENDFLLELVDVIYSNGITQEVCEFIYKETAIVSGKRPQQPMLIMSEGAIQICEDIYNMLIGEITLGYKLTKKDSEDAVDDITNYILMCQRG